VEVLRAVPRGCIAAVEPCELVTALYRRLGDTPAGVWTKRRAWMNDVEVAARAELGLPSTRPGIGARPELMRSFARLTRSSRSHRAPWFSHWRRRRPGKQPPSSPSAGPEAG
jgi:hypothetical protein